MTVDTVDAMLASRRVRKVAAVLVGASILAICGIFVASANVKARPTASVASAMPERPLDVPIMRGLPYPMPMARSTVAAAPAPEKKRVVKAVRRSSRGSRTPSWLMAKRNR